MQLTCSLYLNTTISLFKWLSCSDRTFHSRPFFIDGPQLGTKNWKGDIFYFLFNFSIFFILFISICSILLLPVHSGQCRRKWSYFKTMLLSEFHAWELRGVMTVEAMELEPRFRSLGQVDWSVGNYDCWSPKESELLVYRGMVTRHILTLIDHLTFSKL